MTTDQHTRHPLSTTTNGRVHTSSSPEYDAVRTGFQLREPHRPAAVVVAADAADVQAGVTYARDHDAPFAVQATGHGLATPMDGGVLIGTHRMTGVHVDATARRAWVEAGATWRHVIEAAAPHGLAPLSGSLPGVGAVSYTLGGGIGLLARRYGFAADHVHRLDLVTADGKLRHVTSQSEPDLFWALRGGGGNLGVVTGMEINLMPVARIYGGGLFFDAEQVPDVLETWRRWTTGVPDEMTSAVAMLPFPDLPAVPEPLRGRHVAQIQVCYAGPERDGERLVASLRTSGPLVRDTVRELSYADSGSVFDEPDSPHAYRSDNVLLDDLDPSALATLPERAGPAAPVMCVVGLRHLGGALARQPDIPSAVGHRQARYSLTVLSPITPDNEITAREVHQRALAPFRTSAAGRSLNFSYGPLGEREIRDAFEPQDYDRLAAVADRYDPHTLLACNHPVSPRPA